MKENKEFPRVTAVRLRSSLPLGMALLLLFVGPACGVKQTVKVKVPPAIQQAKSAGFEELLTILHEYDRIQSLSCNELKLSLTSLRKMGSGELEKYRSVKGYILLQRPDSTHLVLLAPIIESKLFDILSVGDDLFVWYPRENAFYRGKNSAKELVAEDPSGTREFSVPIRGTHIYEAVFPQSIALNSPGVWVTLDEQKDDRASYYILTFIREGSRPRGQTLRKIWIERLGLTIARQQVFAEDGRISSDISYTSHEKVGDISLPQQIHIERPLDAYTLDLSFKGWRINPELADEAFRLAPPAGAKEILLRDRAIGH
jgi:hypothetical protein